VCLRPCHQGDLNLLGEVLLLDAGAADGTGTIGLLESKTLFLGHSSDAVVFFLKDRVGFDMLELCLEFVEGVRGAIGATTGSRKVVAIIVSFFTHGTPRELLMESSNREWGCFIPVASSSALLLHFLWVGVDMARLGKVTREMLFGGGSPIGKTSVVTVVLLVGASHCDKLATELDGLWSLLSLTK
jgi:hypothetical protein